MLMRCALCWANGWMPFTSSPLRRLARPAGSNREEPRNLFSRYAQLWQIEAMAWRIHDSVIRGEIDNREKGRVRGKLWLNGLAKPIALDLEGNACPDLAGCLLKFKNPAKTFPVRKKPRFDPIQRGRIGNLSASQKVRVFTIPEHEALAMIDRGEKPPERMANALYLEW